MASKEIWDQLNTAIDQSDTERIRNIVHMLQDECTARTREMEEQHNQLKEAQQMRTEFLAMISHELRTPLNAIIGYNSMLEEHVYGELNEKQAKAVRRIDTNAARLLTLINQLLELSRLEAGVISVFHEQADLVELVNEVLDDYQAAADEKSLEIELSHPRKGVSLVNDKSKVKEIIRQLISNAIKFTHQGSIRIEIKADGDHGILRITDTGPGIDTQQREKIFHLFQQGDSYSRRQHDGAGLGLAIVRRLADLITATILLESETDKGTTFTVRIPSMPETPSSKDAPQERDEEPVSVQEVQEETVSVIHEPHTVLIVDDDPYTVEMLSDYLENRGHYRVQKAYSGMHAMIHLAKGRPDYLLVDLLMPQINGERVIQYCRELWGDEVPIVVITGKDLSPEEQRNLECKVNVVIKKGDLRGSGLTAAIASAIPIPAPIAS